MDALVFLVCAAIAVICGLSVVLQRHAVSSALSLIGVMGSLAILYLILGAEFLAAAQMIVYAGAIMVLFVFVIMLLNAGAEPSSRPRWFSWALGVPALLAFLGVVASFILRQMPASETVRFGGYSGGTTEAIGRAIFTTYLLPFEITSLLVLIAIIGAMVLARKELD